jgi:uncharacterized membrane protein (DUF2068 family)
MEPKRDRYQAGIRAVALFEAAKGVLVLIAGMGLLEVIHVGAHQAAEVVIRRFHLNPAHHYPRIFLDAAEQMNDGRLWLLAALGFCYAVVRLIEAYGLWRQRVWAEWFATASGGLYIPFELYELARGVTWLKVLALTVNIGVVAMMARVLWLKRSAAAHTPTEPEAL